MCGVPLLVVVRGRGATISGIKARFMPFWKTIRLKMYLHSIVLA